MAFPSSPTNGQRFNGFKYNSTTAGWESDNLVFDSSGRVSIGTTGTAGFINIKQGATTLEINTDINHSNLLSYDRDTNQYKILNVRASNITFSPNDVNAATINTSGNLLVGTLLDSTYKMTLRSSNTGIMSIGNSNYNNGSTGNGLNFYSTVSSGGGILKMQAVSLTNYSTLAINPEGGNVYIGTASISDSTTKLAINNDNSWIVASMKGSTGTNRLVMGTHHGEASIGGHNSAHSNWTNLLLNPDNGNTIVHGFTTKGYHFQVGEPTMTGDSLTYAGLVGRKANANGTFAEFRFCQSEDVGAQYASISASRAYDNNNGVSLTFQVNPVNAPGAVNAMLIQPDGTVIAYRNFAGLQGTYTNNYQAIHNYDVSFSGASVGIPNSGGRYYHNLLSGQTVLNGQGFVSGSTIGQYRLGAINGWGDAGVFIATGDSANYVRNRMFFFQNNGYISHSNGEVGVAGDLRVTGTVYGTNGLTSDSRLKTNITPITNGLEKVLKIAEATAHYNYIPETGYSTDLKSGYIAQKLEELGFEGHVTENNPMNEEVAKLLGWEYQTIETINEAGEKSHEKKLIKEGSKVKEIENNLSVYLFPAIKEMMDIIKAQDERIKILEGK